MAGIVAKDLERANHYFSFHSSSLPTKLKKGAHGREKFVLALMTNEAGASRA